MRGLAAGIFQGGVVVAVILTVISLIAPRPDSVQKPVSTIITEPTDQPKASPEVEAQVTAVTPDVRPIVVEAVPKALAPAADAVVAEPQAIVLEPPEIVTATEALPKADTDPSLSVTVVDSVPAPKATQALVPDTPTTETVPQAQESLPPATVIPEVNVEAAVLAAEAMGAISGLKNPNVADKALAASPTDIGVVEPSLDVTPSVEAAPEPAKPALETTQAAQSLIEAGRVLALPSQEALTDKVKTNRLPTIGAAQVEQPVTEPVVAEAAIDRNAIAFDNPSNLPMVAIVLIANDAAPSLELPALPLTIAVDASGQQAVTIATDYRTKGAEMAMMAPLPEGAIASDVEVSFQSYLSALPSIVAIIEPFEGQYQSDRQVAASVVDVVNAAGLGLVTFGGGLNPAKQLAEKAAMPFATIYRDIDGAGQDAAAIRRFLDQAAFRAGQQGSVIVIGHAKAETLAAIADWATGSRAKTITLAPLSAALKLAK
jgi:uncharacterized protein